MSSSPGGAPHDQTYGRRKMDDHAARIEQRLDRFDHLLRGNGVPGLVAEVGMLKQSRDDHAAQLAILATVPARISALSVASVADRTKLDELAAKVGTIAEALDREATLKEGERRVIDKAGRAVRFGVALLGVLVVGGGTTMGLIIDRLGKLAAQLP